MKRKKGFTLIELLVVVAIIAVLISILLPALSQARSVAKITTCLANMGQIGLGMNMYAKDYNDFLPKYYYGPVWYDPNCRWYQRVYTSGNIRDKKILYCPTNPDRVDKLIENTFNSSGVITLYGLFSTGCIDYGMNIWLNGWGTDARWASLSNISDPSKTIEVVECRRSTGYYTNFVVPGWSTGSWGEGVVWPMHEGKSANVLWTDGHVSNVKAPIPGEAESFYLPKSLGNWYENASAWDPWK